MKSSTPTKLTLRLDPALIHRAKIYASEQDRSLSQLVADYFARLTVESQSAAGAAAPGSSRCSASMPITASLRGALRPVTGRDTAKKPTASRADYRAHLEEKYL